MSLPVNRHWMSALAIVGIQVFVLCSLPPVFANQELSKSPWSLLEQHRAKILQISSDDEAIAFFQSTTKPSVRASRTRTKSPSSSTIQNLSDETKEAITTYLASLAVTAHAQEFRKSLVEPTTTSRPFSEVIPDDPQYQWIIQHNPLHMLKSVMDSYVHVSSWSRTDSQPLPPDHDFGNFVSYFEQRHPDWDNGPSSWISLFQQHGQEGIETRLLEYWEDADQVPQEDAPSPSIHHAYAQHFIETRLLPIFKANLLTQTIKLEATAYETARKTWHQIQQYQKQEQTRSATARLCGTWQWIVHNHQNHGDHKMTITFSPPDQSSPSHPEPTTISIQGDTVYLKWTFPQGIQEDSLLLSNNDTQLTGTFKNSLGPHGSISGKRLSTCRS